MLFNSFEFILVYLPVTLLVTYVAGCFSRRLVFAWGIIAALIFYAGWSASYIPLLLVSISFNFLLGRHISRAATLGKHSQARHLLIAAIAVNLAVLGYYKYAGFLGEVLQEAMGLHLSLHKVDLPLGISFFTFTQIAYLVDAKRGFTKEYDPVLYALFVTFFPHLIAGPIIHHREMMQQFFSSAAFRFRAQDMAVGIGMFLIGLAKKVLFADTIAPIADSVFRFANHQNPTFAEAWVGALAYAMQIYFDFSGYSDMALGLSCMLGVRLPLNFNSPYKATSIIDFWRRWHMTLSRFLRDYLYVPLGGNRKGELRRFTNLMVTMALGGLWHGAAWTFVIWGMLHGTYLVANHLWRAVYKGPENRAFNGLSWLLTFLAVVIAWIFFRADSLVTASGMLSSMFGFNGFPIPAPLAALLNALTGAEFSHGVFADALFDLTTMPALLVPLLLIAFLLPNSQEIFARYQPALETVELPDHAVAWRPSGSYGVLLGIVFAVCVMRLGGESPFLYFRF